MRQASERLNEGIPMNRCKALLLVFVITHPTTACKSTTAAAPQSALSDSAPVPEQFKETIAPNEDQLIASAVTIATANIRKNVLADGILRRDAHPKHDGCVRGTFTVSDNVPDAAKLGLFAHAGSWPVWARFSSASLIPKTVDDSKPDARGVAIKLIGVPGAKLLPTQENSPNLDFTLVNIPFFLARDVGEYNDQLSNPAYPLTHPRFGALLIRALSRHVDDPLREQYFSIGAFKMGARAAKFRVKPCDDKPAQKIVDESDPNYLRAAMKKHLQTEDACFDFQVQFQVNGGNGFQDDTKTPIEDVTIVWDERVAPFVSVARLIIPRTGKTASGKPYDNQIFDNPKQQEFCENIAYNPWRTLAAHRPLGTLNRARKVVYAAISKARHEANKAPTPEADGEEVFP